MSFTDADGRTVELWPYRPDGEILERLEWLTDVIQAYDASEQRAGLRSAPRRAFEYAIGVSDRDKRTAENLLYHWQANPWAIPVWTDSEPLAATLSTGTTSIPADTATRDYRDGGQAVVLDDASTWEVVTIDTVGPSSLTLTGATANDHPAGALVMPLRTAYLDTTQRLSRFTGGDSYGRMRWECIDTSSWTAATESTTHRSIPVQTTRPNWIEDIEQDWVRKLAELDNRISPRYRVDEAGGAILLQSNLFTLIDRDAIAAYRAWLYARQGKLKHFWQPSWSQDFIVQANIGSSATVIDVEHSGYTAQISQAIGRRDIRIETRAGTVYYRRITGSSVIDSDTERLTIDSALGAAVNKEDIALVSFLHLARLDADAAELNWFTRNAAESRVIVRGVRNDV